VRLFCYAVKPKQLQRSINLTARGLDQQARNYMNRRVVILCDGEFNPVTLVSLQCTLLVLRDLCCRVL